MKNADREWHTGPDGIIYLTPTTEAIAAELDDLIDPTEQQAILRASKKTTDRERVLNHDHRPDPNR